MNLENRVLIGNVWKETNQKIEVRNPFNNETITECFYGRKSEIEDAIKESPMWEVNNPRVHAIARNLMLMVTNSDTIEQEVSHEVCGYLIGLINAYGDPKFQEPIGNYEEENV